MYTLSCQVQRERLATAQAAVAVKVATICDVIAHATASLAATKDDRYALSSASATALSTSLQASSLRERMFSFLRLADFHVSESVFRHLASFLSDLHAQVCGSARSVVDITAFTTQSTTLRGSCVPSALSGPSGPIATIQTSDTSGSELLPFDVRFVLNDAVTLFPALYAHLAVHDSSYDDTADASQTSQAAETLIVTPTKTAVLELLHRVIGAYMAALDETPRIVRLA